MSLQVGIHWAERSDEYGATEVLVSKMHLDGPADRSGKIKEGDILISVEGENVIGRSLSYLAGKIPGPLNSIVKLTFKTGNFLCSPQDCGGISQKIIVFFLISWDGRNILG